MKYTEEHTKELVTIEDVYDYESLTNSFKRLRMYFMAKNKSKIVNEILKRFCEKVGPFDAEIFNKIVKNFAEESTFYPGEYANFNTILNLYNHEYIHRNVTMESLLEKANDDGIEWLSYQIRNYVEHYYVYFPELKEAIRKKLFMQRYNINAE